jgi:hypothetical protein
VTSSRNDPNYKPDNEIYTDPAVFDALGVEFDLDVCAPEGGLPWIPAKNHYSLKDDGLAQEWHGLVWCNPPYSKPKPWIDKFIEHGNGIMLVQVSRSIATKDLWECATAISLPRPPNFNFVDAQLKRRTIFMPVWLIAMGEVAADALTNSGFGRVR